MLTVSPTAVREYHLSRGATFGMIGVLEALNLSPDPIQICWHPP